MTHKQSSLCLCRGWRARGRIIRPKSAGSHEAACPGQDGHAAVHDVRSRSYDRRSPIKWAISAGGRRPTSLGSQVAQRAGVASRAETWACSPVAPSPGPASRRATCRCGRSARSRHNRCRDIHADHAPVVDTRLSTLIKSHNGRFCERIEV